MTKSLIAIVPLCLLLATSCGAEKKENETFHPLWYVVNRPEDNLDNKCIITKCGSGGLRFHIADHQEPFNLKDFYSKSNKNIVQTDTKVHNWVLTPNFYGSVTEEKFPQTMAIGMKYRAYDDEKGGIPLLFLLEWLAIDPIDYKNAILIIATGIDGKLGVSESLKKELENKKEKCEIGDYQILRTRRAIIAHNNYVQEGKKVFTFIHAAG